MKMFRALSTRRRGYEQLGDEEASSAALVPKLSRTKSSPAAAGKGCSKKMQVATAAQQVKKASKVHPFFSLFETKRKKKPTSRPEFSRYLEYVREGGAWDLATNKPVMHYT